MIKKNLKWIIGGLVIILIVLQFIGIDKQNPPVNTQQSFDQVEQVPQEVFSLIKNACYDCHSHHTTYPWYTNIQPLGWWISGHIDHGREELNFSEWGTYPMPKRQHKMEEAAEEVEEKHMPLKSYSWLHSKAQLSETDRKLLTDWFAAQAKILE